MILFPAIDIQDRQVVRLVQGKFDQVTVYGKDPVAMARHWEGLGAPWLHLVDLDGARTGKSQNADIILQVAQTVAIPVQVGGGIRSAETVAQYLEGGVRRVVLGTKAVDDLEFLKTMIDKWGDRIAVSLDCHEGMVAHYGWAATSDVRAVDFVKDLETLGLKWLIYTDIKRDGMLSGPNLTALTELTDATRIPVIASGGIAGLEDIKNLMALEESGLVGAITGKAIYDGRLDLKEALALC